MTAIPTARTNRIKAITPIIIPAIAGITMPVDITVVMMAAGLMAVADIIEIGSIIMLPFSSAPAKKPAARWLNTAPFFMIVLIPLANLAHDLRVTFAAMAIMLAVTAVIVRIRGLSMIVQIALWTGTLGCAASIFLIGAHLHG
jgi:hypothetical protein